MLNGEYGSHVRSTIVEATHRWRPLRTVRRIAVHRFDHLGDMLLSTPAIRALRGRFPDAEIVVVAGEWNEIVLRHNPHIDRLVFYNSPRFTRHPFVPNTLSDLRRALGEWRPDLIVALRDDTPTMNAAMRSAARYMGRGRSHLTDWLRRRGNNTLARPHEIERTFKLLRDHGIEHNGDRRLDYTVVESERRSAAELIEAAGIVEPFAAVQPGTSLGMKEWSLERFAEVARYLAGVHGLQVVLIGAEGERERTRALREMIADLNPIDITGRLGLRPTVALFERAALYFGSDGGPMHLAAHVGTPTIGLFGPGSISGFYPVGPRAHGISASLPCSPCPLTVCIRPHSTCMDAIAVADAVKAIEGMVRGGRE